MQMEITNREYLHLMHEVFLPSACITQYGECFSGFLNFEALVWPLELYSLLKCSIQFNSDICTRQLINITLARTAKKATIIKYMNGQRKNSINCKKVRFQFCSKGVERESGITQIQREWVPLSSRGLVEPSWTQCLCLGSWDVQLSVQPRGWAHVGATGESWSQNALIGEVTGSQTRRDF